VIKKWIESKYFISSLAAGLIVIFILGMTVCYLFLPSKTVIREVKNVEDVNTISTLQNQLKTAKEEVLSLNKKISYVYHSETKPDGTKVVDVKRDSNTQSDARTKSYTEAETSLLIKDSVKKAIEDYSKTIINDKKFDIGPDVLYTDSLKLGASVGYNPVQYLRVGIGGGQGYATGSIHLRI